MLGHWHSHTMNGDGDDNNDAYLSITISTTEWTYFSSFWLRPVDNTHTQKSFSGNFNQRLKSKNQINKEAFTWTYMGDEKESS